MSDSDDDYVEYGTPLEPIEEDAVPRKKPVLLEDQVVTDAQGRRRFHGAFTGGFSAGFFNTVGSLEGWTPSSFKSSRSERMENKIQKPSDYMDDEDIGEFGIAPQVLRATDDFNHLKRSRGRGPRISDGPIPGEPVLKLLLEPVRETVGLRILRRMGWRPGQGVGPRVIPRVRKRVVGCELPPELRSAGAAAAASSSEASSEEDEAAAAAGITFAPEDIPTFLVHPKTDTFGLGYQGLDRRPVLSSGGAAAPPRRVVLGGGRGGTVSVAGQAFGVGALEEDDEDIYAMEDMSQYDFALGGPASSRHKSTQPSAAQAGSTLEEMFSKALRVSVREHFPPPPLPKDFIPGQRKRKTRFDQPPPGSPAAAMAAAAAAKAVAPPRARSADERAALMGAEVAVGASGEADNEDSRERERLRAEALKLTASLPPAGPVAGAGAGGRFTPFAGHPEKQRRYEQFLVLRRAGEPGKLSYLQPLSMTEWERQREMTEFEQAARLFQPLSADMGERFVSASQSDDSTDLLTPVEKSLGATPEQRSAAKMKMFGGMTRVEESWQPCDLLCKRFNIAKPTVSGATVDSRSKKKVSVFDFLKAAPHNAIQNKPLEGLQKPCSSVTPKLDASPVPVAALKIEKDKIEEDTVPKMEEPPPPPPPPPPPLSPLLPLQSPSQGPPLQLPPPANTTDDISKEKGGIAQDLPFPEPAEKTDLFKAIFLSSSESENEEEKEEDKEQMKTGSEQIKAPYAEFSHMVASAPAEVPEILTEPQKKSVAATPARSGVFANLDLDALMSQPKHVSVPTNQEKDAIQKTSVDFVSSSLDDSIYGPRLPSTLSSSKGRPLPSVVAPRKPSSPVTEWVESTSLHKKKKKKKEKEREKGHKDKRSKSSKHKKHKHSKR